MFRTPHEQCPKETDWYGQRLVGGLDPKGGGAYSLRLADRTHSALAPLYHFTGTAGQSVTISLVDVEEGIYDPFLTLVGPGGETLAKDNNRGGGHDGRDALISAAILPEDGTYFIQAGPGGFPAVYELTLTIEGIGNRAQSGISPVRYGKLQQFTNCYSEEPTPNLRHKN